MADMMNMAETLQWQESRVGHVARIVDAWFYFVFDVFAVSWHTFTLSISAVCPYRPVAVVELNSHSDCNYHESFFLNKIAVASPISSKVNQRYKK